MSGQVLRFIQLTVRISRCLIPVTGAFGAKYLSICSMCVCMCACAHHVCVWCTCVCMCARCVCVCVCVCACHVCVRVCMCVHRVCMRAMCVVLLIKMCMFSLSLPKCCNKNHESSIVIQGIYGKFWSLPEIWMHSCYMYLKISQVSLSSMLLIVLLMGNITRSCVNPKWVNCHKREGEKEPIKLRTWSIDRDKS